MKKCLFSVSLLLATILTANALKPSLQSIEDFDLPKVEMQLSSNADKNLPVFDKTTPVQLKDKLGKSGFNVRPSRLDNPQYAENLIERLDSMVTVYYDDRSDQKTELVYNEQGQEILYITYLGRDSISNEWIPDYKEVSEYGTNQSGYDTQVIVDYNWNESNKQWDTAYKTNYEYYVNSFEIKSVLEQEWVDSLGSWKNVSKAQSDIDDTKHSYVWEAYQWVDSSSTWEGINKYERISSNDDSYIVSYTNYLFDVEAGQWTLKFIEYFDNQGQIISFEEYHLDIPNDTWIGVSKYDLAYDGDITIRTDYIPNNQEWEAVMRSEAAYDEYGNQIHYATYLWDIQLLSWIGQYKADFGFTENGDTTLKIQYSWDTDKADWLPETKNEYSYDGMGMLEWQGNAIWSESEYWQDLYSLSYFYASNDLGEQEIVGWIEYVWDEHGHEMLFEQWYKGDPGADWIPSYTWKRTSLYNENHLLAERQQYIWDPEQQAMVNSSLMVYTYTELGKQASITGYQWNGTEWESILVRTYYYSKIINSNSNPSFSVSLDSYPNPAKSSLNIVGTKAGQKIQLLDLKGKQLGNFAAGDGNTEINVSSLQQGLYIVNIEGESIRVVKE